MTIRVKLSLVLAAGMAVSALASGGVFMHLHRATLLAAEADKIERVARDVSRLGVEAQASGDTLLLLDYLSALRSELPELARCRVRLGGEWREVGREVAGREALQERLVEVPGLDASGPLLVELGFSRRSALERQRRTLAAMLSDLARAVAGVLAAGLCVAAFLGWTMTRRIVEIEDALERIGQGDWSPMAVRGRDEIARLATGVNAMAEELKELAAAKSVFIASVTHELRSPLAAIESQARLLLSRPPGAADGHASLDRILRAAKQLGHFVTNMLEMARIERGKLDFRPRPADLRLLAEDTVAFFGPRAQEAGLSLTFEAQGALEPMVLDPDLVTQVLSNLVSNAIKFTPRGGAIRVRVEAASESGRPGARCVVIDTGVGIPPADSARIFAPFERVPNPLKASGAGLGLAISKSIVAMHGGAIGVESTPGKGSAFQVFLPAQPPRPGARPPAAGEALRT